LALTYWHNYGVRRSLLVLLVAMLAGSSANRPLNDAPARDHYSAPIRYDGRFTLVRLRWGAGSPLGRRSFQDAWSHEYPLAEQYLSAIIRELTYLDVHDDGNEILTLDDPDLFKYPIALMWQPGFWTLTDREAESFRTYLLKGGFAIFEDFDGTAQWANFEEQMHRVLPEGRLTRLDGSDQIFNVFFRIKDVDAIAHPMSHIRPSYYGIFEDNDPSRRLIVVANYDNEGFLPFDASNEAYKLGVNYMIYGLSH
jgi:hypothetical protein